jgi:hypothetical protein
MVIKVGADIATIKNALSLQEVGFHLEMRQQSEPITGV